MNRQKSAKRDPRTHILEVATRLFAERGFDAVSVRDITGAARVNLGAINYYFGSKEQLVHEVFDMLLGPLQSRRLALLDQLEAQAGDRPLDLELVLRALVDPTIREVIGQRGLTTYLPRLMLQAYAVSRPFLDDKLSEQTDHVAMRFINAFARAVPGIPREEICWRYYFVLGAIVQLTVTTQSLDRLRRLSNERCDTKDPDRAIEELIAFFMHGMTAPAPAKSRRHRNRPERQSGRKTGSDVYA